MQNAKRGDLLDFSTVGPAVAKKRQIRLDRAKLNELSARVSERAKAYAQLRHAESTPSKTQISRQISQFGMKKRERSFLLGRATFD